MRGWFVTGTDTGVGKTVVAAALARTRADAGTAVVYVKPVQSGAADGDDDAADVRALAGVPTRTGPVIGPGLAPAVALRRAGERLDGDELVAVVGAAADEHPGAEVIVEGAGGLLVELGTDGTTCVDLAVRLGLPVVVAARPDLGTLNHTALTLGELRRRRLELAGVVVNVFPEHPPLATRLNPSELHRLSGGRLAGILPRLTLDRPLADPGRYLAPELGGRWDREGWLRALEDGAG